MAGICAAGEPSDISIILEVLRTVLETSNSGQSGFEREEWDSEWKNWHYGHHRKVRVDATKQIRLLRKLRPHPCGATADQGRRWEAGR